jgi:uncharacterized repeat protein (TIGR01451 family)
MFDVAPHRSFTSGLTRGVRAGLLAILAALAVMAAVAAPAGAALPSNYLYVLDQDGANDVPSQNDLTQFGRNNDDPNVFKLLWSWDSTDDWTGTGQTGDACALFDTNKNGLVDFVVCARVENPNANPAVVSEEAGSPYAFTCNDARNDRCGQPSPVAINPATAVQHGAIDPITGLIVPSPTNLITNTDPFTTSPQPDQNFPNDTTIALNVSKNFLPTGAELINVCSYPSAGNGGNNNPFDCIVSPFDGLMQITKVAPDGTTQVFSFTVNPGAKAFNITGSGSTAVFGMKFGTTTSVKENIPANWALDSAVCKLEDGTGTGTRSGDTLSAIEIQPGLLTTCTFTNSPKPPDISVVKDNDANHNGTFTDTELVPSNAVYPYVVTYKATISNAAGSSAATIDSIEDDKINVATPLRTASTTDLDCEDVIGTSLAAGASVVCFYDVTFANANQAQVVNTVTVHATNNAGTDSATDTSTVVWPGKLSLTKTADNGTVSAGDQIGYTITLTNNGAGTAHGVTVSDTLPANLTWSEAPDLAACSISTGTLSCNFGDLAAGASASVHIVAATSSANCGTINNSASANSSDSGTASAGPTPIIVNCATLAITKVADAGAVSAGDTIGFTITVTNTGQGIARNVTISDTLPAGGALSWTESPNLTECSISGGTLSCNFGDLAAGASRSVHITSPTSSANCGTINNTAQAGSTNDGSPSAQASVIVNCATLAITKVADAGTVSAGDTIGFTITVTNSGTGTARNVTISDTLPAGGALSWTESPDNPSCSIASGVLSCNFGDLASGATRSVHITSPTSSANCGTINNTASAGSANDGSPSAQASVTVECGDIEITKTADDGAVNAADGIGFLITVTNTGAGEARDVTVEDTLPGDAGLSWSIEAAGSDAGCSIAAGTLTCAFGTLASGASKHVHIVSPTTADSCGAIDNTATVSTSNDGSGQASDSTTVDCPEIHVVKDGPATTYHGDNVTYTFAVTNPGTAGLGDVSVSDDKCAPVTGPTSKTGGNQDATLDPGETWTYTCTMKVPDHSANETNPIVNTVTATGTAHGDQFSDTDTHSTQVLHPAVQIDKTGPATAQAGDRVTYQLVVTNPGDVAIVGQTLSVTDPKCEAPPALVSKARGNGPDPTPATLDPGDAWSYSCTVQTQVGQTSVLNTGLVNGFDSNGHTVSDTDDATTALAQPAIEVKPEVVVSGASKLSGPSSCVKKDFKVRISGKRIASVKITIDGKTAKTFRNKAGEGTRFVYKVNPARYGKGVHRLKARVVYNAAAQTQPRTLQLSFERCVKQVIKPQFTG